MSRGAAAAAAAGRRKLCRGLRRALCAALDLYVRGLTGCAGHLHADAAFGYPTFASRHSFASSGSAASSRRASSAEEERVREWEQRQAHPAAVPRSQSVGAVAMARIDEDGPCDSASAAVFPRSRSCAPGTGRGGSRVAALAA